ncbi:hypothetical protein CsSME_00036127 [Camellia sinensis var. sinensis]
MAGKSKILIVGGTGYIGKCIVEASTKLAMQLADQTKIIAAIKEAGNIKFGVSLYHNNCLLCCLILSSSHDFIKGN